MGQKPGLARDLLLDTAAELSMSDPCLVPPVPRGGARIALHNKQLSAVRQLFAKTREAANRVAVENLLLRDLLGTTCLSRAPEDVFAPLHCFSCPITGLHTCAVPGAITWSPTARAALPSLWS